MQNISFFSLRQDIETLIPKINLLLVYISQQKEERYKHLKEAFDKREETAIELVSADQLLETLGQTYRYDQLRKVQILVEELYNTLCSIDDFPCNMTQFVQEKL